jgi:hypothetical protein
MKAYGRVLDEKPTGQLIKGRSSVVWRNFEIVPKQFAV